MAVRIWYLTTQPHSRQKGKGSFPKTAILYPFLGKKIFLQKSPADLMSCLPEMSPISTCRSVSNREGTRETQDETSRDLSQAFEKRPTFPACCSVSVYTTVLLEEGDVILRRTCLRAHPAGFCSSAGDIYAIRNWSLFWLTLCLHWLSKINCKDQKQNKTK